MIHGFEQEDMQIAEVARQQKGHDLPPTICKKPVTASYAFQHDKHSARHLTFGNNVLVSIELLGGLTKLVQNAQVVLGERNEMLKLPCQRICLVPLRLAHEASHWPRRPNCRGYVPCQTI